MPTRDAPLALLARPDPRVTVRAGDSGALHLDGEVRAQGDYGDIGTDAADP